MKYYETNESCQWCGYENHIAFDEKQKSVPCRSCGEVVVLCSACQYGDRSDGMCYDCDKGNNFSLHSEQEVLYEKFDVRNLIIGAIIISLLTHLAFSLSWLFLMSELVHLCLIWGFASCLDFKVCGV